MVDENLKLIWNVHGSACKAVNGQLLLQIHELNEVIKEVNREKKQLVKQVESLWKNSPVKGEGTNDHDWVCALMCTNLV